MALLKGIDSLALVHEFNTLRPVRYCCHRADGFKYISRGKCLLTIVCSTQDPFYSYMRHWVSVG